MKPKISIIIPIYNKETMLTKCVDSVVKQTISEIEIILVDDGSSDGSGALCDEYKKIDSRISVIHKKNGGLSSARNSGLSIATGEYIGFVDGDDYVAADMYDLLYKEAKKTAADIAMCSFYFEDNSKIISKSNTGKKTLLEKNVLMKELVSGRINVSVWNKIYNKSIIEGIIFREGQKYCEDVEFTYRVFNNVGKAVYIDVPKYYYGRWDDSQSKHEVNPKMIEDSIYMADFCNNYILENHSELAEFSKKNYARELSVAIYKILYSGNRNSEEYENVWQQIEVRIDVILEKGYQKKNTFPLWVFMYLAKRNVTVCEVICKMIRKLNLEK